jgi:hypothetical protein
MRRMVQTAKRILAWAAWGGAGGVALGYGIGVIRVAQLDCTHPVTCEWSGFIPIGFAFWGLCGGVVVGIVGCLIYQARERRRRPPSSPTP